MSKTLFYNNKILLFNNKRLTAPSGQTSISSISVPDIHWTIDFDMGITVYNSGETKTFRVEASCPVPDVVSGYTGSGQSVISGGTSGVITCTGKFDRHKVHPFGKPWYSNFDITIKLYSGDFLLQTTTKNVDVGVITVVNNSDLKPANNDTRQNHNIWGTAKCQNLSTTSSYKVVLYLFPIHYIWGMEWDWEHKTPTTISANSTSGVMDAKTWVVVNSTPPNPFDQDMWIFPSYEVGTTWVSGRPSSLRNVKISY